MATIKSKYNSNSLLSNPTWNETIYKIKQYQPKKRKYKIPLIVMALTGIRLGEFVNVKKKDVVYFDKQNKVVDRGDVLPDLANVYYLTVSVMTLKQRGKKKLRNPTVLVTDFVRPLLIFLHEYLKDIGSEDLLWPNNYRHCRWCVYRFDKDFYPHLLRHILATRDGLSNMNLFALKKKFGWTNLDSASCYVDLNAKDLLLEEERISCEGGDGVVKEVGVKNGLGVANNFGGVGVSVKKKRVVFKF